MDLYQNKTIVIFGASGRTGRAVSRAAKACSINVREFNNRNPTKVELKQAVKGVDSVVIVFGPRSPFTDIFCTDLTKKIVSAMEAENVKRLICQTGAMIGVYPGNRSFLFKIISSRFKKSNPQGYLDRVRQEDVVINSSLEWTIIKPPRLTDAVKDKKVKAGENIKVGLLSSIPRKNLAKFIIEELVSPQYIHRIIFVKSY